ncbi:MAG: hypothetical protein LUC39_03050, partial [Clostridiales bacterium]|nr:hypothetical protein [Clostridiales bacterium]
ETDTAGCRAYVRNFIVGDESAGYLSDRQHDSKRRYQQFCGRRLVCCIICAAIKCEQTVGIIYRACHNGNRETTQQPFGLYIQ